jgi:hypothetical protein
MTAYSDDEESEHDANPYRSPDSESQPSRSNRKRSLIERVEWKIKAPAVALIVVGSLGVVMSIVNVAIAVTAPPPVIDPNDPPFIQGLRRGQVGPVAITIQSGFIVYNSVIIAGAVQMLRFRTWALGLVASIMAMINIGTCCCVIGLPIGIWSLIILLQQDVKKAFEISA